MVAFFGFQFLEPHCGSLRASPGFRSRVGHIRATAVGEMVAGIGAAVGEIALFVWMALVIAFWLLILANLLQLWVLYGEHHRKHPALRVSRAAAADAAPVPAGTVT